MAGWVVEELSLLHPAPNPRDESDDCDGCVQLVTTDAVSVYQWPDVDSAARHAHDLGEPADHISTFVLSYRGAEQAQTSAEVRAAYADGLRELLAQSEYGWVVKR